MFTGIISHLGKLKLRSKTIFVFEADSSFCRVLKKGGSVAVNGVCLTIKSKSLKSFAVEVMPETLRRTNLGDLEVRDLVNLELAMRVGDRFDGHLVLGHIDGAATVRSIKEEGNSRIFGFEINESLGRYIIEKGAIAVNGISLTVIAVKKRFFSVGIIPFTWENTILRQSKVGDRVNIEVDILAKYVLKLINA